MSVPQVRAGLGEGLKDLPVLVADSNDPDSLRALTRRSRLVISTAGPFALYGSGPLLSLSLPPPRPPLSLPPYLPPSLPLSI